MDRCRRKYVRGPLEVSLVEADSLVAVVGVHKSAEVGILVAIRQMGCALARPEIAIDRSDQLRMVAVGGRVPETAGTATASVERVGALGLVVVLSEAGWIGYYW